MSKSALKQLIHDEVASLKLEVSGGSNYQQERKPISRNSSQAATVVNEADSKAKQSLGAQSKSTKPPEKTNSSNVVYQDDRKKQNVAAVAETSSSHQPSNGYGALPLKKVASTFETPEDGETKFR